MAVACRVEGCIRCCRLQHMPAASILLQLDLALSRTVNPCSFFSDSGIHSTILSAPAPICSCITCPGVMHLCT